MGGDQVRAGPLRAGNEIRGARSGRRGRVGLGGALCLVTGAGSGIGRETAMALARLGANVLVTDVDYPSAKQCASDCDGVAYELDVSDRAAVHVLHEIVEAEHGTLDVLVNNAGVGLSGPFADTSLEDWDWILGVNLLGVLHCCNVFGRRMVERGSGQIVNVSSGLGYFPTASESAYCTTKSAVLMLSRCLRADWAGKGVGVSVVCPGVIDTPILEHTRFRGPAARPEAVRDVRRMFARRGHPPTLVAEAILRAIEHDRPVVPVGIEAWAGWALRGIVPSRLADRAADLSTRVREGSR